MSEKVLIIQNTLLRSYIQNKAGCLIRERKEQIFNIILKNQMFMLRDDAEYNFDYKQVIPYVVIRHGDNYLLLQRLNKQREKRLHDKFSLGIGGHVNPDALIEGDNIIINGLYKEFNEEVSVAEPSGLEYIGIISDESNSVSRVHLGLLYVINVLSSEYRVLETEKMTAQWVSRDNLKEHYRELETWSQIVYDQYIKTGAGESRSQGVNRMNFPGTLEPSDP